MKTKIKVTYESEEINKRVDKVIKNIIDHIGGKWYGQGFNAKTGVRDICFDLDVEMREERLCKKGA